jgi:hypothetical protein
MAEWMDEVDPLIKSELTSQIGSESTSKPSISNNTPSIGPFGRGSTREPATTGFVDEAARRRRLHITIDITNNKQTKKKRHQ